MRRLLLFKDVCLHDNVNRMVDHLGMALTRCGCAVELIDLRDAAAEHRLVARLDSGEIELVVSFTGFGLDRRAEGNLYARPGLRLVSVYLDPLLLYWDQVSLAIPGRLVTTISPDDLSFCRTHLPGRRVALLPHSAPLLPVRPWAERDVALLFAGSVPAPPETMRAGWRPFGAAVERRLNAMLDAHRTRPTQPIAAIVAEVGAAEGLALERPLSLHPYVATLDSFLRVETRWRGVAALLDRPLRVVGSGWDGLAERGGRAVFTGPLPAATVEELTGRAQIALNVCTPWHGSHERLFLALSAGTALVSTWSAFAAEAAFAPALALSEPGGEGLPALVDALLADPAEAERRGRLGAGLFRSGETWDHRAAQLLALTEEGRD